MIILLVEFVSLEKEEAGIRDRILGRKGSFLTERG